MLKKKILLYINQEYVNKKYCAIILSSINVNNIVYSYFYFNNKYIRFFPEYITTFIHKYFKYKKLNNKTNKKFLNKLYLKKFKHIILRK